MYGDKGLDIPSHLLNKNINLIQIYINIIYIYILYFINQNHQIDIIDLILIYIYKILI